MIFDLPATGKATAFTFHQGGKTYVFKRKQ